MQVKQNENLGRVNKHRSAIKTKLEKHSESADLRQGRSLPHMALSEM